MVKKNIPTFELLTAILDSDVMRAHQAILDGADPNTKSQDCPSIWRPLFGPKADDSFVLYEVVTLRVPQNLKENNVEILRLLLKHGADVNLQNKQGFTATHQSASFSRSDALSLLIDHDANIDLLSEKGYSPLHTAIYAEAQECVLMLLKAGANLHSSNSKMAGPLDYAKERSELNPSNNDARHIVSILNSYAALHEMSRIRRKM